MTRDGDTPPSVLDTKVLVARRNEAGLSRRELAQSVGVSQSTIRLLEQGANHDVLTLGLVVRICTVLGIQLGAVLGEAQSKRRIAPDDRLLEAALADNFGRTLHRSDLERGFGWAQARFTQAVRRLDERLAGTGLMLHRSGWGKYSLRARADVMSNDERERVLRASGVDRKGLDVAQAQMLRNLQGSGLAERRVNNAANTRITLGALQKQGLVETDPDQGYHLTEVVNFSLGFGSP